LSIVCPRQVVGFYDDELARVDGTWKYVRHAMRVRYMSDAPLPGTLIADHQRQ
jgi:hypothetical protein